MRHINRGVGAAVLAVSLVSTTVACTSDGGGDGTGIAAAAVDGIRVADEGRADGTGAGATRLLVDSAPVAVVAAADDASQARAASVAVGLRAPMLTAVDGAGDGLTEELDRLGVERVLRVGEAPLDVDGVEVVDAPADREGLEELTGISFHDEQDVPADRVDDVTVHQQPGSPSLLSAGDVAGPADSDAAAFAPAPAAWEGEGAPVVLVHDETPLAAVATAVAAGAAVSHLRAPDPRVDAGSVEAVRGAETVLALGPGWGSEDELRDRVERARTVPELPGGGQLLFPGRRFVAAYGSPITPALGILGEQGPEESAERVRRLVEEYQPFSPEPVLPAFEIIATVASTSPGDDGNFTNEWPAEEFVPLIDAITEAGGYAVIDLQPGMADLLDQAKLYEELLKRPNVGLALDPEWKLTPGQQPGAQIGSADADEINRVVHWLADLTAETGGPQKLLILHQFNLSMLRDRERIDTSREELAISLHADGHGSPQMKFETWDVLRKDLSPDIWMAWKNFYDEDSPTFTPEETMAVVPRPWFVSYQ